MPSCNKILVVACGRIENLCRRGFDHVSAAVKYVQNSKDDGVAESNSSGERQNNHGNHCERHY